MVVVMYVFVSAVVRHLPPCMFTASHALCLQVTKTMTLRYEALEAQRDMPPAPS